MNKITRRYVTLFSFLVSFGLGTVWWYGLTSYPAGGADGEQQKCKIPFFNLGKKTKTFFGDAIVDGTAKLTHTVAGPDGSTVFALDSKGAYEIQATAFGEQQPVRSGVIPRPEAQRIFNYIVRRDVISTKFSGDPKDFGPNTIKLEANGKTKVLPDLGPLDCAGTQDVLSQMNKIYDKNVRTF